MSNTFALATAGSPTTAEMYSPPAKPVCLIVIAYGSEGLVDYPGRPWETMIRGYASALADKGFCTVIPDYLRVTNTTPGKEVYDSMFSNMAAWQKALSDAIDQSIIVSKVDPKRVGLLGFSLGGHLVLRLRSKAKVLVEFFAPRFNEIGAPGTLTHAQIHHGEKDEMPATGFPNAALIEAQLTKEGTATEVCPYRGAGHGFIGTDPDNTYARDQSKTRTLAFFQSHL